MNKCERSVSNALILYLNNLIAILYCTQCLGCIQSFAVPAVVLLCVNVPYYSIMHLASMVSESEQLCGAHLRCHSSSTSISVYTNHNKTPLDNNRAQFMTLSSQIKYIYQINIIIFLFFLLSHLYN